MILTYLLIDLMGRTQYYYFLEDGITDSTEPNDLAFSHPGLRYRVPHWPGDQQKLLLSVISPWEVVALLSVLHLAEGFLSRTPSFLRCFLFSSELF